MMGHEIKYISGKQDILTHDELSNNMNRREEDKHQYWSCQELTRHRPDPENKVNGKSRCYGMIEKKVGTKPSDQE